MGRRDSNHVRGLQSFSRFLSNSGSASTAAGLIVAFFLLFIVSFIGFSVDAKHVEENYQMIFEESGRTTPFDMEEAAVWANKAEYPMWTDYPILFDYQEDHELPDPYNFQYGWTMLSRSNCEKETAEVRVEYRVDNVLKEILNIPVFKTDGGNWSGSIKTDRILYEAFCRPDDDIEHFTVKMILLK